MQLGPILSRTSACQLDYHLTALPAREASRIYFKMVIKDEIQ